MSLAKDGCKYKQAVENGPSAATAFLGGGHVPLPNLPQACASEARTLRRNRSLVVATYRQVRLTPRFLAALHLDPFEQPAPLRSGRSLVSKGADLQAERVQVDEPLSVLLAVDLVRFERGKVTPVEALGRLATRHRHSAFVELEADRACDVGLRLVHQRLE